MASPDWIRPATHSRSLAPPAHALRCAVPFTAFFDFRLHPQLQPADIVRIFNDPALAFHEDILGIRFLPKHHLAQVTFRSQEALDYHLTESANPDADVRCWPAIHPDQPIRTLWLRGTPICEPELLDGWIRDALRAALPSNWHIFDIRLQYFPDTNILTDSAVVSILLPRRGASSPTSATNAAATEDNDDALFITHVPREITISGVPGIQLTWPNAPPYCVRCKCMGHSKNWCPQSPQRHQRRRTRRSTQPQSHAVYTESEQSVLEHSQSPNNHNIDNNNIAHWDQADPPSSSASSSVQHHQHHHRGRRGSRGSRENIKSRQINIPYNDHPLPPPPPPPPLSPPFSNGSHENIAAASTSTFYLPPVVTEPTGGDVLIPAAATATATTTTITTTIQPPWTPPPPLPTLLTNVDESSRVVLPPLPPQSPLLAHQSPPLPQHILTTSLSSDAIPMQNGLRQMGESDFTNHAPPSI